MAKVLFVCSGGGHLKQLVALSSRMGVPLEDQLWSTFDNGLSRSLLKGREVVYMHYAAPRDAVPIIKNVDVARRIFRERDISAIVSTGSSPAVSFFSIAALNGVPRYYIESAARAEGPSLSGNFVGHIAGTNTFTQYPSWADEEWQYRGSIYDSFTPTVARNDRPITRAVVSLGTQETFQFARLIDRLVPLLRGVDVLWQVGATDVSAHGIDGRHTVPHDEIQAAVAAADVVIAHSGTGAALTALEAGRSPVLVPRLARFGEHIDNHQLQIGTELARRDLAVFAHPEQLSQRLLLRAASRSVDVIKDPPFLDIGLATNDIAA
jgi:UDP-N-acetylglucosamine--N-acetylmuramyl-(pentapeptide) pyrophosphoryl-undecaprenol N-acetylglucosamine transferase